MRSMANKPCSSVIGVWLTQASSSAEATLGKSRIHAVLPANGEIEIDRAVQEGEAPVSELQQQLRGVVKAASLSMSRKG